MDRLSQKAYADFYEDGTYRRLTGAFNRHQTGCEEILQDQSSYAAGVISALEYSGADLRGKALLDIGGSAGAVAAAVASRFEMHATVLDPAAKEIEQARASGLEGVVGVLETFETARRRDVILLCRSIEHLFNLRGSLQKIHELLRPDGLFYCDIVELVSACRRAGCIQAVTKIDHCYWLCQETAPAIFQGAGFEVVLADLATHPGRIGYLLRPCAPLDPPGAEAATLDGIIRRLRDMETDWSDSGGTGRGLAQSIRSVAYRTKRKVLHALPPFAARHG